MVVVFCFCINKNGFDIVVFDVIIDIVIGRYREKFYIGISLYGVIVFFIFGLYIGFFYIEV